MRAIEKNENDANRAAAMGSYVSRSYQPDQKVVETFNRPPYAPVLNFERGVVANEE